MPANPYNVTVTVYDTDSSTLLTGVQVNIRNETNDEVLSETTDGRGQVVINAANFPSEYIAGDILTVWCVNGSDFKSTTHTITSGGVSLTLTLIDGSTTGATELRYFTVGEFREFFCIANYNATTNSSVPKDNQIQRIGTGVEEQIDRLLTQRFDNNSGSNYTVTDEYHDTGSGYQQDYYSRWAPIISVTKFEINTSTVEGNKDWTDLVAETDGENLYEVDNETGRFRVEKDKDLNSRYVSLPLVGANQVRLTYQYGATTVPDDIKRLAIIWTGMDLAKSNLMRLSIVGTELERSGGSIDILESSKEEINKLINARLRRNAIST